MPESSLLDANAILAAKGKSFHWARHFLGKNHAQRATRLYRLCRYIDDIADEHQGIPQALSTLSHIKTAFATGISSDPIIKDGLLLLEECKIDPTILIELVMGIESDLTTVRIPDEDALLRYCYQVAGTVGLMMCKALETDKKLAFAHAIDLGMAMQLTNICRDVAADAALGRRYLPASVVGDLSPEEILNPSLPTRKLIQNCLNDLLALADRYYQSGEQGLVYLPPAARAGVLLSARLYRAIGDELQHNGLNFWQGRAVVGWRKKSMLSILSLCEIPFQRKYWRFPDNHDSALHAPLLNAPRPTTWHFLDHAS